MSIDAPEFVGPTPEPEWEAVRPSHEREKLEWGIEEIGISFTANPTPHDPTKWDVEGKDATGNKVSYSRCELLRDPENPRRIDIVRQFISKHKKELVIGIAGGAVVAMAGGKGVEAFQKHRATSAAHTRS